MNRQRSQYYISNRTDYGLINIFPSNVHLCLHKTMIVEKAFLKFIKIRTKPSGRKQNIFRADWKRFVLFLQDQMPDALWICNISLILIKDFHEGVEILLAKWADGIRATWRIGLCSISKINSYTFSQKQSA